MKHATDCERRTVLKAIGLGALASLSGGAVLAQNTIAADTAGAPAARPYALGDLPYAYNALEPVLSEEQLTLHHQKHHAGYVKGLNATLEKLDAARKSSDYTAITSLSRALAFHGSGHVLHTLYWHSMRPGHTDLPSGPLNRALERDFGSLQAFRQQFAAAAKAVEGSGWGILAWEPLSNRLLVLQSEKHENMTIWGAVPLMVCDVWEHAYYLQYKNLRGDYVDRFMEIIDWREVEKRYLLARGTA